MAHTPVSVDVPVAGDYWTPAKNAESYWLSEDEDPDVVRTITRLSACPHPHCSTSSFKNADIWTYKDPVQCVSYLMRHLIYSSKHYMEEHDAQTMILDKWDELQWTQETETRSDRKAYHDSCSHQVQESKKRGAVAVIGKPPVAQKKSKKTEGQASSSSAAEIVPAMAEMVTEMKEMITAAKPVLTLATNERSVNVPISKMKLVQDSLVRAEHAISEALVDSVETAKKLQAERTRIISALKMVEHLTGEHALLSGRGFE